MKKLLPSVFIVLCLVVCVSLWKDGNWDAVRGWFCAGCWALNSLIKEL